MYLSKANLLFEMARYADAEPLLREALVENPNDPLAHAMLGVALSRLGRGSEALDETATAIGLGPTESYCFYARSLVFIRTGQPLGAWWAIDEAIRLDPHSAEYHLIRGALLFDQQQWNRALAALDQALQIEPGHVRSLNLRGRTLLNLGRREEAEQAIEAAIAAGPQNADAHHARGVMLLTRAQTDEAIDHLLEARRLNPLTFNDPDSIALAVGRRMVPFRWANPQLLHWERWPGKVSWAVFSGLMFALVEMVHSWRFYNFTLVSPAAFGSIVLNAMLAPLTLDALASFAARVLQWRLVGTTWRKLIGNLVVIAAFALLHGVATRLGAFPAVLLFVLSVASVKNFAWYCLRQQATDRRLPEALVAYGILLGTIFILMETQLSLRRFDLWVTVAAFSLAGFFSDDLVRRVRRKAL